MRRVRGLLKGSETAHLGRDDLNARGHIVLSVALWLRTWIVKYEEDEFHLVASRVSDLLVHGMAGVGGASGHAGRRHRAGAGRGQQR